MVLATNDGCLAAIGMRDLALLINEPVLRTSPHDAVLIVLDLLSELPEPRELSQTPCVIQILEICSRFVYAARRSNIPSLRETPVYISVSFE